MKRGKKKERERKSEGRNENKETERIINLRKNGETYVEEDGKEMESGRGEILK